MNHARRSRSGFTLVEFMISIGILALIAVGSFGAIAGLRSEAELEDARTSVRTVLEYARSRAITGVGTESHGVHIETRRLVSFEGPSYPGTGRETALTPFVSLSPAPTDVIFSRLSGKTGAATTITVTHVKGATAAVLVDANGIIISP